MEDEKRVVLAIDPGRCKCGLAVVRRVIDGFETLHRSVVDSCQIKDTLSNIAAEFDISTIIIGNGTGSGDIVNAAESAGIAPVQVIDERNSTMLARKKFFIENPPRGLLRLIPTSLQVPNRPYDDYVAVMLAESFLK